MIIGRCIKLNDEQILVGTKLINISDLSEENDLTDCKGEITEVFFH
jgi:hypothetical protein